VLRDGIDEESGGLKQAFHRRGADVSLLMAPWLAFPASEDTLRRTVQLVLAELREGGYLRRYAGSDGLSGKEGAFLVGSFWLADALLFLGEAEAAEELLDALVASANDVGLFAEEIDPRSGMFRGNMPQAIVHLALIHSAARQMLYRRRGRAALAGTHADRARRHIGRASRPAALLSAVRQSMRVRRMTRSTRSVLYMP
jgi:alpha,alpha-trehalase